MTAFLAMGGYAAFVWPAYGISLAGLATIVAVTVRDYRRAKAQLASAAKRK